jgi:hypothetical protein
MILTRIPQLFSLYSRWKRRQLQQTSPLLGLPVEILRIVEDFLSDVETTASGRLVTTCITTSHGCSQRWPERAERLC